MAGPVNGTTVYPDSTPWPGPQPGNPAVAVSSTPVMLGSTTAGSTTVTVPAGFSGNVGPGMAVLFAAAFGVGAGAIVATVVSATAFTTSIPANSTVTTQPFTLAVLSGTTPGNPAGVPPGGIKLTTQGGMDLGAMLLAGSGVPTMSAPQGALYVNTTASTSATRLYINNSSGVGTTWTAFTSAA